MENTVRHPSCHPFSDLSAVETSKFTPVHGDGAHVFDTQGRSYLNATANLWFANVGHGPLLNGLAVSPPLASTVRELQGCGTRIAGGFARLGETNLPLTNGAL